MKTNFNFEYVPLSELEMGREAIISDLDDSGPHGRRLADLGLLPETPIVAVRRAPLGDPVAFEVRGTLLCLRRCDAARVRVRLAPSGAKP